MAATSPDDVRSGNRAEPDADVVVLGAGPAGSAAATLLARRAHTVLLVRPARPPAPTLGESIPPSARRVLDELGALEAVDAAGLWPNRGNAVWWAGASVRREDFAGGAHGVHTDRASLEEVLVGVAEAAGARVLSPATARAADRLDGLWRVRCDTPDGERTLHAHWVVDATGRHGLLARDVRRPDRDTTTLALVRRWRRPGGWEDGDDHHTIVESFADGWAWSVPLSAEVRCVTAMIDQRHTDVDAAALGDTLDAALDRAPHVGALRAGAERDGDAWACPASLYTAERFTGPGLLLAGDAGSFIDPLSSFGVKKALSSGWLAGVAAHTALVDAPMAEVALDFFDSREREVYGRYRRISAEFFQAAADAHRTDYWRTRARAATESASDDAPADPDQIGAEIDRSAVVAAFEALKARATVTARPGRSFRVVHRPAIEGHRIVMQDQLASDACPEGIRYVRGVDLGRLLEVAPRVSQVPDGWTAYNGVAPPVTLPDYLTALATAFAAGLLEHDG